jgi:hypothetical protein
MKKYRNIFWKFLNNRLNLFIYKIKPYKWNHYTTNEENHKLKLLHDIITPFDILTALICLSVIGKRNKK